MTPELKQTLKEHNRKMFHSIANLDTSLLMRDTRKYLEELQRLKEKIAKCENDIPKN